MQNNQHLTKTPVEVKDNSATIFKMFQCFSVHSVTCCCTLMCVVQSDKGINVRYIIMLERCSSNGCRYSTAWPPFLSCMQVIPLLRSMTPLMCFLTLDFQPEYLKAKSYLKIITLAFHKFTKSQISLCIAIVHSTCTYSKIVDLFIYWLPSIFWHCDWVWQWLILTTRTERGKTMTQVNSSSIDIFLDSNT